MIYICIMKFKIDWDTLGISASLACAIHCAILPLVMTSLPILGIEIIRNTYFEFLMIFLSMAIGIFSLWHGFRKHHHSKKPLIVFLFGMVFLFAKQIWHLYEIPLMLLALIFIVYAHLNNQRSCRVHNHAHSDDCDH